MTDYERTTTRETTTDPTPTTAHTTTSGDRVVTDDHVHGTSVRTTERAYAPAGPGPVSVIGRFITFLFGILQVALVLRIVLLLLVANEGNEVVRLILGITDPFVEPFRGMFSLDRVTGDQGSVLDVAAIVALIGWTLIELLLLALLRIFDRRDVEVV